MPDEGAPEQQVTSGIPGKLIINGALVEVRDLRVLLTDADGAQGASAPAEPAYLPPPIQPREREPIGPLAPIPPLDSPETILAKFLGKGVLGLLAVIAVLMLLSTRCG